VARTKIVATIGPASNTPEMIEALFEAGVDVFRLNMSHGDHATHANVIESIRRTATKAKRPAGILCDLSGPKIRVGMIAGGSVDLVAGARLTISSEEVEGTAERVSSSYEALPQDVTAGERILLDDGLLELEVVATTPTEVECKVIRGGKLSSRKGLNLPGTHLRVSSLTDKDRADMAFGISQRVDLFAMSFVRDPNDIDVARKHMRALDADLPIIAKVEKAEAVEALDEIVCRADGCMVARGDLGVEIPIEQVPVVQKRLIRLCQLSSKPVITATQMLDSMLRSPQPTRAEATDVANAILDGTDAVMLSGETAVGPYAVQAVEVMDRIATAAETIMEHEKLLQRHVRDLGFPVADAIAHSAATMAEDLRVAHVLCLTLTGTTARLVARYRPRCGILAYTPSAIVAQQLSLTWGVRALAAASGAAAMRGQLKDLANVSREAINAFQKAGCVHAGERIVIVAGMPLHQAGNTNLLRVYDVP
jgi:pyruvate kinase